MKKIAAFIICISLILTACSAQSGNGQGGDSGEAPSGASAEHASDMTAGTVASDAEGASEADKPGLVILGKEETDYARAAQSKKGETTAPKTSALYSSAELPKISGKDHTVMIYIVGSNLESRYGAATNDIKEMIGADVDFDRNNILIYTGGCKRWNSDISNTYNSVLNLSGEDTPELTAQTKEAADMGTPATLTDFINYCTANFPAEHYGLILWDHGAGPLWGYGSDELFSNDSLLLEELRDAMDGTVFGQGRKLDWVGFDACLMGSIENAGLWKDYAGYLVGSEEVESGRGWDYSFLSVLNETSDAREIVSAAVDAYGRYYEENKSEFFNPDVTLAALDLSKTEDVVDKANLLFKAMADGISEGQYASLNRARSRTKAFGLSAVAGREEAYDLLDLRDLSDNLDELYPEQSEEVRRALDGMIVNSVSNVTGAGGVSIYFPGDNRSLYEVAGELYPDESALSGEYGKFVDAYMESYLEGINTDWNMAAPSRNGDELTLQLTEDQVKNSSQIYYTVLCRNSFGGYGITTGNIAAEPDENNILHIPSDPMLLTAETDEMEAVSPLTCVQVESSAGESTYRTIRVFLTSGHEYKDLDSGKDEQVVITVKNRDGENEASIVDIISSAGSAWAAGKESVDVSYYKSVINGGSIAYSPVRDEEGRMRPFTEWSVVGYEMFPMCLDKSFKVTMKHASEFNNDFICQVTVRDINGNLHGSEYTELEADSGRVLEDVTTEKGAMHAEVMEDHAEITGYEGEDTQITVPDAVAGKPVTVIARDAFYNNKTIMSVSLPDTVTEICGDAFGNMKELKEINLPDGLKKIGVAAFRRTAIEEITIPESVEEIGRGAFSCTALSSVTLPAGISRIGDIPFGSCANLEEIAISGDNPHYETPGGVLYSKETGTLIQYPGGKKGDYKVQDGTEEIGYAAFADSAVEGIGFPDSLRRIGNMAFYDCHNLKPFTLPDALESVGDLAFSDLYYMEGLYEKHHFDSVHIGPSVSHIGMEAFDALETDAFEVDEGNSQFASVDGFLTGKAKDTIIAVPMGIGNLVVIPDGITTLQNDQFQKFDPCTEFVIPDSTFRFAEKVFPFEYGETDESGKSAILYKIRLHCSENSAAEKYAAMYDIPYDNITDPEELVYEEVVEETEATDETAAVTMVWNVYKDRAELVKCASKDDGTLTIPAQFRGLPVTALRTNNSDTITDFPYMGKIVIPDSVKEIETDFLEDFTFLGEIEVDDKNETFRSSDGVLFTADGKTLLYYPGEKNDTEYAVPDKVENIGDSAVHGNYYLTKVTLPASLEVIGTRGFGGCYNLTDVEFNKGLKEIGESAFSAALLRNVKLPPTVTSIGSGAFTVSEGFGRIELPESLKKAGYGAFRAEYGETFTQDVISIPKNLQVTDRFLDGVLFERFEVDGKNEYHTCADGLLMSADGRTLQSVPTLWEGDLIVPEGTMYIDYSALKECSLVTDIYLPDSVLDIGGIAEKDYETGEYPYVIHCSTGTEAQKKLEARGVPWVATD